MILFGTYTESMPHVRGTAGGLLVGDYRDGMIGEVQTVPARNPTWVAASSTHVYCVGENGGGDPGTITVFARMPTSLEHLQTVESGGFEPAHLALDPTGRFLAVANYADGVVSVLELTADGLVGRMSDRVQLEGSSIDPDRQLGPHAHQVLFDRVAGVLLVADLGSDAVIVFELGEHGRLAERTRIALPAGSGPRHAALHPDGVHLLVLSELANTIAVFRRDGETYTPTALVSTLPADGAGISYGSALAITSAGDRVYAANRGHDSIAVFAWTEPGTLEPLQFEPTRGRTPRDFTLSPDERLLHVANQDSNTVTTFARNRDGLLQYVGSVDVATPACVLVVR